jgi:hypothetical protein
MKINSVDSVHVSNDDFRNCWMSCGTSTGYITGVKQKSGRSRTYTPSTIQNTHIIAARVVEVQIRLSLFNYFELPIEFKSQFVLLQNQATSFRSPSDRTGKDFSIGDSMNDVHFDHNNQIDTTNDSLLCASNEASWIVDDENDDVDFDDAESNDDHDDDNNDNHSSNRSRNVSIHPTLSTESSRANQSISIEHEQQQQHLHFMRKSAPLLWPILCSSSSLLASFIGYERHLQHKLTAPPLVFGQVTSTASASNGASTSLSSEKRPIDATTASTPTSTSIKTPLQLVYDTMSTPPNSILQRKIVPSFGVGTHPIVSSTLAYLMPSFHPSDRIQFRQILTCSPDGTDIALDWELPTSMTPSSGLHDHNQVHHIESTIRNGPIRKPVVLILHGVSFSSVLEPLLHCLMCFQK